MPNINIHIYIVYICIYILYIYIVYMCIVYIYICHIVSRLVQPRRYKAAVPRDDASIQFHGGFRGRRGTEGYNGGASLHRHPGGEPRGLIRILLVGG